MAERIEDVLSQLDSWYNELPGGTERPKMLSKLATLELCGWLEERFDAIAAGIAQHAGVQAARTVIERIERTYGFHYSDHLRAIFLAIGGELLVLRVETAFQSKYPGELDRLQSTLGVLWKQRCELAHASSVASSGKQLSVNAPSWSINQQRILEKLISKFESELRAAVDGSSHTTAP